MKTTVKRIINKTFYHLMVILITISFCGDILKIVCKSSAAGSLEIQLKDSNDQNMTGNVVESASYSIYYKNGTSYLLHNTYSNIKPNRDGIISVPVFSGNVECLVVENTPPANYFTNKVTNSSSITKNTVFFYDSKNGNLSDYGYYDGNSWTKDKALIYTKDNSKIVFEIVDRKYQLITGNAVTPSKFDLYFKEKGSSTPYKKIVSPSNFGPDQSGRITLSAYNGNYVLILVENTSPTGYVYPSNLYSANGLPTNSKPCAYYETSSGKITEYGVIDTTTKEWIQNINKIVHSDGGMIEINKIDGDERPVSEITMALRDAVTKVDIRSVLTDGKGKCFFKNLPKGKYEIYEKKSKTGYIKTNDTWVVEVDENGSTKINSERTNNVRRVEKNTVNERKNLLSDEKNIITRTKLDTNDNVLNSLERNMMLRSIPANNTFVSNDSNSVNYANGYSVSQNIEPTATKGMYKVNVSIKRTSKPVDPKYTDYVFAIEASDYSSGDNQRMGLADRVSGFLGINKKITMSGYYDLVSEFADNLKTTQPNARIGIILYGNNGTGGKGILENIDFIKVQNVRANLQLYRAKEYSVNADKDWGFPYAGYGDKKGSIDMFRNADPSKTRNRVLINVTCGGLNESSGGLHSDGRKISDELINSNLLETSASEKIDIYYTGEWAKNSDANHSNSTQIEHYLSETYIPFGGTFPTYGIYYNYLRGIAGGNPIKAVKTFYNNVTSSSKEGLRNNYRTIWDEWTKKYNEVTENPSQLNISFDNSSNIILNSEKNGSIAVVSTGNTMGAVVKNNSIVAENLRFKQNETKTFSYYVHANSEKKGIKYYQSNTTPNWNSIVNETYSNFYPDNRDGSKKVAVPQVYHTIPSIKIRGFVNWNLPEWKAQSLRVKVRDKTDKIISDWKTINMGASTYTDVAEVPLFDNEGNSLNYYMIYEKVSEYIELDKATLKQSGVSDKSVNEYASLYEGNPELSNLEIDGSKDANVILNYRYKTKNIKVKIDWHKTIDSEKYPVKIKLGGYIKDSSGVEKDITNSLPTLANQGDTSDREIGNVEKYTTTFNNLRVYNSENQKIVYFVEEVEINGKKISEIDDNIVDYVYLDSDMNPVSPQNPGNENIDTIVISNTKVSKPIEVVNELEKNFIFKRWMKKVIL